MMNKVLEETIQFLISEAFSKFNLRKFIAISAGDVRPETKEQEMEMAFSKKTHPEIEYAAKWLPIMSSGADAGSSREVFAYSTSKVLKIAKNKPGIAQNKAEVEISMKNRNSPFITKIYEYDAKSFKWVIADLIRPLSNADFSEKIGIPLSVFHTVKVLTWSKGHQGVLNWIKSLKRMVTDGEMLMQNSVGLTVKTKDMLAAALAYSKNKKAVEFMTQFIEFAKTNSIHQGDVVPAHFGETADGRIVFYDYGATIDVIRKHYK